jgi:hypothetical protein
MTTSRARSPLLAAAAFALLLLFLAIPAALSLANGDGAVCFTDAACPLAPINPCVRKPSFAVVGRCALPIK